MNDKTHAVQRIQDYIERHLSESITLAELARAARFSPWYSARIFRELTGLSPADYIRRLRLSRSTLRLRDEKIRVIDAAAELGFESVDGYRVFAGGHGQVRPRGNRIPLGRRQPPHSAGAPGRERLY